MVQGFRSNGMLDIDQLNKSLNLRSIGRMMSSDHPLFKQLWQEIGLNGYFNLRTRYSVDQKLVEGLKLLNLKRLEILNLPVDKIKASADIMLMLSDTRLKNVLTSAGRYSISAFSILNLRPNIALLDLNSAEIDRIEQHLVDRRLAPLVKSLINQPALRNIPRQGRIPANELYPLGADKTVSLMNASSKILREHFVDESEKMICLYKSGVILSPGEVLNWTNKIKKLTSSRHNCALLRIAHADVYTNGKLFKFGLINDPKCEACQEPIEDLTHRFIDCQLARQTWQLLENKMSGIGLEPLPNLTIESIIGAGEEGTSNDGLALTLRAELASRIMTKGGKQYSPIGLVKASLKTVLTVENLTTTQRLNLRMLVN